MIAGRPHHAQAVTLKSLDPGQLAACSTQPLMHKALLYEIEFSRVRTAQSLNCSSTWIYDIYGNPATKGNWPPPVDPRCYRHRPVVRLRIHARHQELLLWQCAQQVSLVILRRMCSTAWSPKTPSQASPVPACRQEVISTFPSYRRAHDYVP